MASAYADDDMSDGTESILRFAKDEGTKEKFLQDAALKTFNCLREHDKSISLNAMREVMRDYDCSKQFVFAYAKIGSYYDNWPDNSNDSSDNSDGMIAIPVELSLVLCSAKEGLTAEWSKIVYPDELWKDMLKRVPDTLRDEYKEHDCTDVPLSNCEGKSRAPFENLYASLLHFLDAMEFYISHGEGENVLHHRKALPIVVENDRIAEVIRAIRYIKEMARYQKKKSAAKKNPLDIESVSREKPIYESPIETLLTFVPFNEFVKAIRVRKDARRGHPAVSEMLQPNRDRCEHLVNVACYDHDRLFRRHGRPNSDCALFGARSLAWAFVDNFATKQRIVQLPLHRHDIDDQVNEEEMFNQIGNQNAVDDTDVAVDHDYPWIRRFPGGIAESFAPHWYERPCPNDSKLEHECKGRRRQGQLINRCNEQYVADQQDDIRRCSSETESDDASDGVAKSRWQRVYLDMFLSACTVGVCSDDSSAIDEDDSGGSLSSATSEDAQRSALPLLTPEMVAPESESNSDEDYDRMEDADDDGAFAVQGAEMEGLPIMQVDVVVGIMAPDIPDQPLQLNGQVNVVGRGRRRPASAGDGPSGSTADKPSPDQPSPSDQPPENSRVSPKGRGRR